MKALAISIFMLVCAAGSVSKADIETKVKDINISEMKEIKMNTDTPDFNIKDIEIKNPKMKMKDFEIAIGDVNVDIEEMEEMPEMCFPDLSNYDFGFSEE